MIFGSNYFGGEYPGGNGSPAVSYMFIKPATLESPVSVFAPQIKNEHLVLYPEAVAAPITPFEPQIYGAIAYLDIPLVNSEARTYAPDVTGSLAPNDTAPSYNFFRRTFLPIREIIAGVQISFIKGYDPNADFFTVGSSAMDSGDVFQGNGSTVQEWDKFSYTDYSDYLRSISYTYSQDVLGSMILGYADVTLDNTNDTFSPYGDSPIANLILPYRPLKIYSGFKQEPYQVFVGQTTRLPDTDSAKAQFHAMDFIASFADKEITYGRTYVNVTTDQIIDDVLQNDAGLSPVQYVLDTGLNTIKFLHVEPGKKIGDLFRDLMQAEAGRLYQTADGEIRFDNRNNKLRPTALIFSPDHIYSEKEPSRGNVINRVKIEADVREATTAYVQILPALKPGSLTEREDFSPIKIAAGETIDKFFNFSDPVIAYDHAQTNDGTIVANSAQDGSGTDRIADVTFSVQGEFTTSVKYRFTNNGTTDLYIRLVKISARVAPIVEQIRIDVSDATSIDKYGENTLTLDNDAFTDTAYAQTLAEAIVAQNKDAPSIREITTKGIPYAAVGDVITYYDNQTYVIDKIAGKLSPSDGNEQDMLLRKVTI